MLHQQDIVTLRDYVTEQLQKGATETQLRSALMREGGWSVEDLNTIFALIPKNTPPVEETVAPAPVASVAQNQAPSPTLHTPIDASTSIHPQTPPQVPAPAPVPPSAPVINAGFMRTHNTPPAHFNQNATVSPGKKSHTLLVLVGMVLVIALLGGAGAWAYYQFAQKMTSAPYTQENFLSGLYAKSKEIQTLTSTLSATLVVEGRDVDARPFILPETTHTEEWRTAYIRDAERVRYVVAILQTLSDSNPERGENLDNLETGTTLHRAHTPAEYPATLQEVESSIDTWAQSYRDTPPTSIPLTEYRYAITKDRADFTLTVTFETDDAIQAIHRSLSLVEGDMTYEPPHIENRTITFNKKSYPQYFLFAEPPQPLIAQLHEQSRFLPAEFSGSLSVKTTMDRDATDDTDAEISLDGSVDFGDMSYVIGGDFRKVDSQQYAQIRHLPGILMMFLGQIPKNTWIHLTSRGNANDWGDTNLYPMKELMDVRVTRGYNTPDLQAFVETIVKIADEEDLLRFRSIPQRERVDGTSLYRYDLMVHRPALVPFLKRAYAEVQKNDALIPDSTFDDAALITYLESDEFSELFAYLEQNISLVLHVDTEGYPIRTEYSIRLVPPDTATQLAGKQVRITLLSKNTNINKPISITVPENAVPLQQVMEDMQKNMEYGRTSAVPNPLNMVANVLGSLGNLTPTRKE